MSSTQPRKQPDSPKPDNNKEEAPVKLTPKEQFKYGDVKVKAPGVGSVTIVLH
jgi:hypothetical protein